MKSIYILLLFIGFSSFVIEKGFAEKLSDAAISITKDKVVYDPKYVSIAYPKAMCQKIQAFVRML